MRRVCDRRQVVHEQCATGPGGRVFVEATGGDQSAQGGFDRWFPDAGAQTSAVLEHRGHRGWAITGLDDREDGIGEFGLGRRGDASLPDFIRPTDPGRLGVTRR